MTRVTAEIEINGELLIIVKIYKPDMMADHITSLQKKLLMRVINKHYDRSAKGILSKPTRRFPHTKVSCMYRLVTYNMGNKTLSTQLYSARHTRQEERKDSKDMQGYLTCEFIASVT